MGGAVSTCCQGSFRCPLIPLEPSVPWQLTAFKTFPGWLSHTKFCQDQSHLVLTSRCARGDTIDKSSFLLRPSTRTRRLRLHRGPPAKRLTFKEEDAAQEAVLSPEQGVARTNSADSLAVWEKDQSALVFCWGRRLFISGAPRASYHDVVEPAARGTRAPRNVDDS